MQFGTQDEFLGIRDELNHAQVVGIDILVDVKVVSLHLIMAGGAEFGGREVVDTVEDLNESLISGRSFIGNGGARVHKLKVLVIESGRQLAHIILLGYVLSVYEKVLKLVQVVVNQERETTNKDYYII